jgi:hypothetical protein
MAMPQNATESNSTLNAMQIAFFIFHPPLGVVPFADRCHPVPVPRPRAGRLRTIAKSAEMGSKASATAAQEPQQIEIERFSKIPGRGPSHAGEGYSLHARRSEGRARRAENLKKSTAFTMKAFSFTLGVSFPIRDDAQKRRLLAP